MGYRRAGWESDLGGAIGIVVILGIILAVAIAWTILTATVKELARLATRSATYSQSTLRVIRWTAGSILGLIALCALVGLLVPGAAAAGVYAGAWGFLLFVLVVEACDWHERRLQGDPDRALGDLDTYLDFTAGGLPAANGHQPAEKEVGALT